MNKMPQLEQSRSQDAKTQSYEWMIELELALEKRNLLKVSSRREQ